MLATEHPIIRLPVFLMGVFAGVLCIRIQQGDYDALQVGRPIETSISEDPQPHPQSLRFFEVEDRHFRNFEVF